MPAQQPLVAVVILSWNNPQSTIECLQSFANETYENFVVVICDNGSRQDSFRRLVDTLQSACICDTHGADTQHTLTGTDIVSVTAFNNETSARSFNIHLLRLDDNYGYAGGNNRAIRYCRDSFAPDFIFIVNSDVSFDKGVLSELIDTMNNADACAIAGALNLQEKGLLQSGWGGVNFSARLKASHLVRQYPERFNQVDSAMGSAMLIRSGVFSDLAGFDEEYFLYHEDADLCLRARSLGYKTYMSAQSMVVHPLTGTSTGKVRFYYFIRNKFLFMRKHVSGTYYAVALLVQIISSLRYMITFLLRGKIAECGAVVRATFDGLTGKYGIGYGARYLKELTGK